MSLTDWDVGEGRYVRSDGLPVDEYGTPELEPEPWEWPTSESMRYRCLRINWAETVPHYGYLHALAALRDHALTIGDTLHEFARYRGAAKELAYAKVALADLVEQFKEHTILPKSLLDRVALQVDYLNVKRNQISFTLVFPDELYHDNTMLYALGIQSVFQVTKRTTASGKLAESMSVPNELAASLDKTRQRPTVPAPLKESAAMSKDPHLQPEGQPWRFDNEVTKSFTEMIEASIPGYHDMRALSFKLGRRFLPDSGGVVIDIGSSRGDSLAPFVEAYPDHNYYATEVSKPMREVLEARFPGPNVTIVDHDLRYNLSVFEVKSDLIINSLSIMFVPLEHRMRLVQAAYDSLKPGGALLFIEKMLGADSYMHDLLDAVYLEMKHEHGYTHEQILRKKLSLEGVLVPMTLDWNLDLLQRAGFKRMDVFWRSLQFGGILAVKD